MKVLILNFLSGLASEAEDNAINLMDLKIASVQITVFCTLPKIPTPILQAQLPKQRI